MPYNGFNNINNQQQASQSKKSDSRDASTTGVRLTNYDAMKYLNINYWKRACSIDIGPIPQGVTRSNPAPWDWKASMPTMHIAMTFTTLTVLEDICDEVWDSIRKSGTFSNVGAPCGSDLTNLVEINNGSTIGQPEGIYLVLYRGRDANGVPERYDFYPFSTRVIERGFNPTTGHSTKDISKTQDFKDFRRCIHEAVSALTMAVAHSVQEVQNLDKLSIIGRLASICAHQGISIESATRSAGGQQPAPVRQNNQWKSNSNGYKGNHQKKQYGNTNGGYGSSRYGASNSRQTGNPPWGNDQVQDASVEISISSPSQADFDTLF